MDSHHEVENKVKENVIPLSKYSNRVELKTLLERSDGGSELVGERIVIGGWVKSSRAVKKELPPPNLPLGGNDADQSRETGEVSCTEIIQSRIGVFKKLFDVLSGGRNFPAHGKIGTAVQKLPQSPSYILYLLINDGSSVSSLQVVLDSVLSTIPASQLMALGTSMVIEGVLRHPSAASGKYVIELKAEKLLHVGTVKTEKYPLSKKQIPLHMLRDYSHFRPRTTTVASVTRIHSALTFASHTFFQYHGFQYVQVPIITTINGEGFGETFQITTLLNKVCNKEEVEPPKESDGSSLDAVKAAIKEKITLFDHFKRKENIPDGNVAAVQDLKQTGDLASKVQETQKPKVGTLVKPGMLDLSKEFFSRQTYLTVSGKLHLESYACALGNVYTFGPSFRSDKIDNVRHLAETWNVETEMAFSELHDAMNSADEFFKILCKYILDHRSEDLKFISKRIDKNIINRLEAVTSTSIARISYTEVIDLLQKAANKSFETKPEWGIALTTEHLSYVSDEIYKGPVIIFNYPKGVKPFYARLNDDNKTVAAFDMIAPKVGVLISGSEEEERFEKLDSRIKELGLPRDQYEWYLDLRRHGSVKHSGFSLKMELMLVFVTGLPDVRDAVPFPRSWGRAHN